MTADLTQQFQFERVLRGIEADLIRHGIILEVRFLEDEDYPLFIAFRGGRKWVFTEWRALQRFAKSMDESGNVLDGGDDGI